MSLCRSCGAEVRWCITARGNRIPIDPVPSEGGNLWFNETGRVEIATKKHQAPDGVDLFLPHHATCPQGKAWKR